MNVCAAAHTSPLKSSLGCRKLNVYVASESLERPDNLLLSS
jgi:hypothetical protein